MKYYLYISDTKIDMLLMQIPQDKKRKLSTEFKIDLKVFGASRKTETETGQDRITRLEAVCTFIREFGNLGSIDHPNEYIEDTLSMSWGRASSKSGDGVYVYFGGMTDKTVFGLGGSLHHLIGSADELHTPGSLDSLTPFLIDALRPLVGDKQGNPLPQLFRLGIDKEPLFGVFIATTNMRGPKQRLEFMAKRLAEFRMPDGKFLGHERTSVIILGSPLYVAMAE